MGFSSLDDFFAELSSGKQWRQDFIINTSGIGTVVAGRWYDTTMYPITGTAPRYSHGNMIYNGDFLAGIAGWTLSSANLVWTPATHLITKSGANSETITQDTSCVSGVSYSVVYTIGSYAGSGNIAISLGGTAGTNRSANGTYRETISCGATANAPLVITIPGTVSACTIDLIAVTRDLGFTPYTDADVGREAGIWHGGDVSTDTKHLTNIGAVANVAAACPCVLLFVDMLGCYPRIPTNSASLQTFNNTLTLPRYTDGKGVRAFYQLNTANGTTAQNVVLSYTNTTPTSGRGLGTVVSNTVSAIVGHIIHSGVAAGNFGPFLPLAGGDQGIKSVESLTFSAASTSAGFVDLVLCKPLAYLPLTAAFYASERDLLNQLPSLPRVYDGAIIGVLVFAGAVLPTNVYQGYIETVWG